LQYFYKKSIGIAIANSFLTEYLYWYWQYFTKVLLTTLRFCHIQYYAFNLFLYHVLEMTARAQVAASLYCDLSHKGYMYTRDFSS